MLVSRHTIRKPIAKRSLHESLRRAALRRKMLREARERLAERRASARRPKHAVSLDEERRHRLFKKRIAESVERRREMRKHLTEGRILPKKRLLRKSIKEDRLETLDSEMELKPEEELDVDMLLGEGKRTPKKHVIAESSNFRKLVNKYLTESAEDAEGVKDKKQTLIERIKARRAARIRK